MNFGELVEALTPDFYSYPWLPLQRATLTDSFVTMQWSDGLSLTAYSLWLAENSLGMGLESKTRESVIDPADLPDPSALRAAEVGPNGELELTWRVPDRAAQKTTMHPGWLRHLADQRHRPASYLPSPEMWTAATFTHPPSVDGGDVLVDPDVLTLWLTLLSRYGLALLRNTPATPDFLLALAAKVGPVRSTNFGEVFDVKADIDPTSTANTGLNLGQHTDLPTRETPPGFQFLHCIANTVAGGRSRMTDGFAVVAELREHFPIDYEALTTLRWVFFNRSRTEDHRWSGPVIDHVDDGYPLTIRAFYPVRAFPDMALEDVPRAYAAMRRFSSVAHDPRFQVSTPFVPGDLVGFDNRRILHGRDAFEAGGGERHLRGCYIDQDDVYSRLRVLTRAVEQHAAQTSQFIYPHDRGHRP